MHGSGDGGEGGREIGWWGKRWASKRDLGRLWHRYKDGKQERREERKGCRYVGNEEGGWGFFLFDFKPSFLVSYIWWDHLNS